MVDIQDVDWNNIKETADIINNWANGAFPGRNPDSSLMKLVLEEIPEILQHKKKHGIDGIGEELADCLILLFDLSVIWGVDLPRAIEQKMLINVARIWDKDESTGFYNHRNLSSKPPEILKNARAHLEIDSEGGTCD